MAQALRAYVCFILYAAALVALAVVMPAGAQSSTQLRPDQLLCACPDVCWDIRPQTSEVTHAIHRFNVEKVTEADMAQVRLQKGLVFITLGCHDK